MSVSTCGGLIHGGGLYSGGGAYSRRFTVPIMRRIHTSNKDGTIMYRIFSFIFVDSIFLRSITSFKHSTIVINTNPKCYRAVVFFSSRLLKKDSRIITSYLLILNPVSCIEPYMTHAVTRLPNYVTLSNAKRFTRQGESAQWVK